MKALSVPDFVLFVLQRLRASGHQAFIVGGAVRDACLGRPISDWDVATSASFETLLSLFHDVRHFTAKPPTVTLVHRPQGRSGVPALLYEVTTFRGSGKSLREDLGLRDFTMNAMAYDPEKECILDPYGGRTDLASRLVRAVGDPSARYREDPLRLLRAVRFGTELGFSLESETRIALASLAPLLASVSPERIRVEFVKILRARRPSRAIRILAHTGLLAQFLPEILEGRWKRQTDPHPYTVYRHTLEATDRVPPEPVLRLAALLHDIAKPRVLKMEGERRRFMGHEAAGAEMAAEILRRLRFANEEIRKVTHLILHHRIDYSPAWGDGAVRRFMRRVGLEFMEPLFALRKADLEARGTKGRDGLELLEELQGRILREKHRLPAADTSDLAVDGRAVMKLLGIGPGPRVGRILRYLLERVTEDPRLNNERDLTFLIQEMGRNDLDL